MTGWMMYIRGAVAALGIGCLAGCAAATAPDTGPDRSPGAGAGPAHSAIETPAAAFAAAKTDTPSLRRFLEAFPKGGDIHNHLTGAVYAERWMAWAAEDGLCVDEGAPALKMPGEADCAARGWVPAGQALEDGDLRRRLINALSLRSFVARDGWSGHDQFFSTFPRTEARAHRFDDMLAAVSRRAGRQNIQYLELMRNGVLGRVRDLVGDMALSGDMAADYERLMAGPFGAEVNGLVADLTAETARALAGRDRLLDCDTPTPQAGCGVQVKILFQAIRNQPPAAVFAQFIVGWRAIAQSPHIVGLNLVAPEDDYLSLRDYTHHMRMLDWLYRQQGPRPVALHAGELVLGMVTPGDLRFHIRQAIELGHARRIGHGISIAHERDSAALVQEMAEQGIAVEINLTSNDTILDVTGRDHPFMMYRRAGVPTTLSTDDEGVSRIDLTHEYLRAVQTYDLGYADLKDLARTALREAFVDEETRRALLAELEGRFAEFERAITEATWLPH